jgi:Mn2+/Fe2+ NRAMP family transporter
MIILILAEGIMLLGIDPIKLVQYVVILSVVPLPLTYYPILKAANDNFTMGEHKNGRLANILGWSFFILTCIAAAAAIPLMIVTHGGQG